MPDGRTPIAGVAYTWAEATGHGELLLLEREPGLQTAVALVSERGRDADGDRLDAATLPVGDIDVLVTELRAQVLGDRLIAEGSCPACGTAVDVDFSLRTFRAHRAPRQPRGAELASEPGWWRLRSHDAIFRLPTTADVLAAQATEDPARALGAACVRPSASAAPTPAIRAAERAMAALAPPLRDDVEGHCPDCDATVILDVDARELCLAELRFLAHGVLEDVHVLAGGYGWSEQAILGLPVRRRVVYAEFVRSSHGAPVSAEAFVG
jgi:hypothetical protein